jgi:hypothetical protein
MAVGSMLEEQRRPEIERREVGIAVNRCRFSL